jgi:hypothetical protein
MKINRNFHIGWYLLLIISSIGLLLSISELIYQTITGEYFYRYRDALTFFGIEAAIMQFVAVFMFGLLFYLSIVKIRK